MKDLGGYFGFENLPEGVGIDPGRGLHFASGRQALAHWLSASGIRRLHLPGWICPAVLDAVSAAGATPVFYHLGPDLLPDSWPDPAAEAGLLLLNAFGLLDGGLQASGWPEERVIVDDTMAFFRGPRRDLASFNSWRKFLPVPDGASLYALDPAGPELPPLTGDDTFLRQRAAGGAVAGRDAFRAHEEAVADWPLAGPSQLATAALARLDGDGIRRRRRSNFDRLHSALGDTNALPVPEPAAGVVPMAYPFLPAGGDHHEALWSRRVWAPRLWGADSRLELTEFERRLAVEMLPLPVDHRYGPAEMDHLVILVREATA